MDDIARYALTGSVVASALGGIVLCALILRYGLTPPEDEESPPLARRRALFMRTGHAIAAVCFAATALLAVVALAREPSAAVAPVLAPDVRRLEHDVGALDARLGSVEEVLERVGTAVDGLAARLDPSASPPTLPPPERRSSGR